MADFPTLPSGAALDSSKFEVSYLDTAMRQEIEGGYTFTRPRTTRALRRLFRCGYTDITDADRQAIETHMEGVRGGSLIFNWVSPQNLLVYQVRYKSLPTFTYTGIGALQKWNCSFELEQA